jgi:hypothetical protein
LRPWSSFPGYQETIGPAQAARPSAKSGPSSP